MSSNYPPGFSKQDMIEHGIEEPDWKTECTMDEDCDCEDCAKEKIKQD